MAAPNLQDMLNRLYVLIGQDADTDVLALDAGDNSAVTISNQVQGAALLQQAAKFFCRSCYPITAVGSGSEPVAGNNTVALENLITPITINGQTAPTGTVLWAAVSVQGQAGSVAVPMQYYGEQQFGIVFPPGSTPLAIGAAPTAWSPVGDGRVIRVAPTPQVQTAITVTGYCLPYLLVDTADDYSSYFPDDIAIDVLPAGAAVLGALQGYDDPRIRERMGEFTQIFNDAVLENWSRLDEFTQMAYFGGKPKLLLAPTAAAGQGGG